MVTVPKSAKIVEVTSEPTILNTQDLSNTGTKVGSFHCEISQNVTNTVSSGWSTGGTGTIEQKTHYGVGISFAPVGIGFQAEGGSEISFSYSQSWGVEGKHSESIELGSSSGLSVDLGPGDTSIVELSASRGVMKVEVQYDSYLTGQTAVNYNPKYKGHHFKALGIGSVMRAGKISNSVPSTQTLEIEYYSHAKIELKDKETNAPKGTHYLDELPGH